MGSWTDRILEANSLEEVMLTSTAPPVGPVNWAGQDCWRYANGGSAGMETALRKGVARIDRPPAGASAHRRRRWTKSWWPATTPGIKAGATATSPPGTARRAGPAATPGLGSGQRTSRLGRRPTAFRAGPGLISGGYFTTSSREAKQIPLTMRPSSTVTLTDLLAARASCAWSNSR